MGRVSKRKAAGQQVVCDNDVKRYKAGIYARLSSDQDIKKNESVEVQIEIAKKFVEEFNQKKTGEIIDVVQCYTDLGKTGSNFEREGFLRLLQDIRLGEINCVIVKDLSRFGRNYLEAGNYIEKIFPFLGVRFIAVADGFDTGKAENENKQMASEIKNLVNDMYAKDFSKKAKIHLKQRREEGSYVGGPPPYGYVAEWNGKRRVLLPDDNTAVIVQFIYEKFVETESYTAVADLLNRRKINPPSIYKKTKEIYHSFDEVEYKGWDKGSVERILKSDTYVGTLVQGKTSITARDEKNRVHKSEDEWVVTKDAHEPLIDNALYQKVVEIREKITRKTASHKHPTKGYRISKTELVDILIPLIRMEFAVFLDKPKKYMEFGNERISEAIRKAEASLRETEGKIRRFREEESSIYMDYRSGNILQKDYVAYKMKQEDKLIDLRKIEEGQKKEIKALEKLSGKYLAAIKALLKLKSGKELTKEMVEAFISKIYVYPGKRIEVLFTFTADCMEGVK